MSLTYFSNKMRISGTGSHTPQRVVTNDELAQRVDTSPEWIYENLGIKERRICEKDERTSDIAYKAGIHAIESARIDKNDIDLIIVATATPDRKAPSTASLVKKKLGITNFCPVFDISAVCSGFVYALSIASGMIQNGAHKRILVIGADTFSKITDWSRKDCVFFGDGAGAVIVEESNYKNALFSSKLFADCTNTDHFTVYPKDDFFTMNGRAVYETGIRVLPDAIRSVLGENNLDLNDVLCIIPHQPSIRLLKKTAEVLNVPFSKIKTNMEKYANTSAATIPMLVDKVYRSGEIKRDDLVVFAAVGSGWAWGAAVYRWH